MKGLIVGLLENKEIGNASLGGISTKHVSFVLTGEGVPEIFEPDEDSPEIKLVKRIIYDKPYLHVEPIERPTGIGWMFGGCFVWSSDSRFPNTYPIALHDRQESPELHEHLSR